MTAKEIQARNAKAESLRVLQADDGSFYVESEKGKILYNVVLDDQESSCTCGDFAKNSKKDSNFQCKHMLAVLNAIPNQEIENARFCEKSVPKLDDRFMTNIKGKDFVLYAGVLDLATQAGLLKLEVELLQFPTKENGNEAICRAVAESKTGEVFADIGDANPANCHSMIAKHLIRMASTRAKGRALRDMCNIGIACLEELADFDDVIGTGSKAGSKPKAKKQAGNKPEAAKPAESKTKGNKSEFPAESSAQNDQIKTDDTGKSGGNKPKGDNGNGRSKTQAAGKQPSMSEAQKRAIYNLSRRRGVSVEDLEQMSIDAYSVSVENLTSKDASAFIRNLQQAA
jgi:predicted nucleic acid-binding Zn finger protein